MRTLLITPDRNIGNLHPEMREPVTKLSELLVSAHKAGKTQLGFELFEGYRHPARQNHLFAKRVTKATAWQSAHQFGLAVDFVPVNAGKWIWDGVQTADWEFMRSSARALGLRTPISWDLPHLQHPLYARLSALL